MIRARSTGLLSTHLSDSAALKTRTIETSLDSILEAASLIAACFRRLNKVLICGNGGSAADAQRTAAEFVNRLSKDFERPGLPAIAITTDTSFLTSYANDYGYDGVFERQVQALGQRGDLLVGVSTSGNSSNVIKALVATRESGIQTIALIGEGGEMTDLANHAVVVVPGRDTQQCRKLSWRSSMPSACWLSGMSGNCLRLENRSVRKMG